MIGETHKHSRLMKIYAKSQYPMEVVLNNAWVKASMPNWDPENKYRMTPPPIPHYYDYTDDGCIITELSISELCALWKPCVRYCVSCGNIRDNYTGEIILQILLSIEPKQAQGICDLLNGGTA